jgi:hypothetical protein
MIEPKVHITQRVLRAPRTAATAGIIFGLLMGASLIMMEQSVPPETMDSTEWLEQRSHIVNIALSLLPFAGIAFLWFMGVVRDRLGYLEDQFFSTLFFGSGLLYLAMSFAASAIGAGALAVYAFSPSTFVDSNVLIYSQAIMYKLNNVYALKMAGMHMIVLGTMWIRTKVMPRWIALISYALALVLLFTVGYIPRFTLIFPVWVLVISIYILYLNFRFQKIEIPQDGLTPEETPA